MSEPCCWLDVNDIKCDCRKRLENAIPKLIAFGGHGSWHSQVAKDIAQTSSAIVQQAVTIRAQAAEIEELKRRNSAQLSTLNHMGTLVEKMEAQAAEIDKMRDALETISKQRLTGEIDEDDIDYSDIPYAYDECVLCARKALEDTQ